MQRTFLFEELKANGERKSADQECRFTHFAALRIWELWESAVKQKLSESQLLNRGST